MLYQRLFSFTATRLFLVHFLFLLVLLLDVQKGISFEKHGNTAVYKGNTFEFKMLNPDTTIVEDPITGKHITKITPLSIVAKMNGRKIYTDNDAANEPEFKGKFTSYKMYLLNALKKDLEPLPDGDYDIYIEDIVVGPNGKIVYFKYGNIQKRSVDSKVPVHETPIPAAFKDKIDHKIKQLLDNAPPIQAATYKGQVVPFLLGNDTPLIQVRNHKMAILGIY